MFSPSSLVFIPYLDANSSTDGTLLTIKESEMPPWWKREANEGSLSDLKKLFSITD
jgi:hypothetical protein